MCSAHEAQAVCDEVAVVAGRRDIAGYIKGMDLIDVVRGAFDAVSHELCHKITPLLEACESLVRSDAARMNSLMLPAQLVQACVSVGLPISIADMVAEVSFFLSAFYSFHVRIVVVARVFFLLSLALYLAVSLSFFLHIHVTYVALLEFTQRESCHTTHIPNGRVTSHKPRPTAMLATLVMPQ